ncbi:MAG TPA: hypothetical protein VN733_06115 [Solirubrobacterales bacterium]|nr:hypothetical protein [Solirubrobacterales bacterium]
MRHSKTFGLIAMAAMALAALAGPATASATELYKGGNPGTTMSAGEEIVASLESGTSATLISPTESLLATCTGSELKAKITSTGSSSSTVKGSASALSFSSCSTAVTTKTLGELEIHHIAETDNGTVTAIGFDIVATLFGVECGYGAGSGISLGTLTGNLFAEERATLDVSATLSKVTGGFLCPATAKWSASYTVTSPTGLNVASEQQQKVEVQLDAPAFKVGQELTLKATNTGDVEWSRVLETFTAQGHTKGMGIGVNAGENCTPKAVAAKGECQRKLECTQAGDITWIYDVESAKGVKAKGTVLIKCT